MTGTPRNSRRNGAFWAVFCESVTALEKALKTGVCRDHDRAYRSFSLFDSPQLAFPLPVPSRPVMTRPVILSSPFVCPNRPSGGGVRMQLMGCSQGVTTGDKRVMKGEERPMNGCAE